MSKRKRKKWETTVFKDPNSDDLMIEFPADLLEKAGWKVGDMIHWEIIKEGHSAILTKVSNKDDQSSSSQNRF